MSLYGASSPEDKSAIPAPETGSAELRRYSQFLVAQSPDPVSRMGI
jgi:hypothetical protein